MKVKVVAKAAERLKEVGRPGFLAAYLLLALREDGVGRVKLGKLVMKQLAEFANNLVSYPKLEVAFSDFLSTMQIERGMEALRILESWELGEKARFQAREDILAVKAYLDVNGPKLTDSESRIQIADLLDEVNKLWEKAVEKPQKSRPTKQ